ncbi:MAG: hypothetical protein U9Q30_05610, partial [Campylobacterota bacterium]|nr:hypothetical protein [Campylobacterota bacterium]
MFRFFIIIYLFLFIGCSIKEPKKSESVVILLKTPLLKFYDKGFLTKYDDFIDLKIFTAGQLVLELKIYKDKVCKDSFRCVSSKEFNSIYFDSSYKNKFLYELFSK